jgi:D-alanyl-D-alanine carboxypeptidase (penicillin-binding protein 5/6)
MRKLRLLLFVSFCALTLAGSAEGAKTGRAAIGIRSADPYLGAIVEDAATGKVLFEDKADEPGYPASVIKLMDLLLIEERIVARQLSLTNRVHVTAEAANTGGSQVYLAEKEVFPLEDLLAALAIHSANDAAVALAVYVGGTRNAFVDLMNKRAAELGMTATRFHSVHGLPPATGQEPDVSTARDLAALAREVLKHPDVLRYASMENRPFRNGTFTLRNPNHLLQKYPGCDGLKTGYFAAGGFSIVATAQRNGRRVIAVVVGSKESKVRDATAMDLLSKGFLALESLPPPPPAVPVSNVATSAPPSVVPAVEPAAPAKPWNARRIVILAGAVLVVLALGIFIGRMGRPTQTGRLPK